MSATIECDVCRMTPGSLAPADRWLTVEDYYRYVTEPAHICSTECLIRLALDMERKHAHADGVAEQRARTPKRRRWFGSP